MAISSAFERILFAFLVIALNPYGSSGDASIWTHPKLLALFLLMLSHGYRIYCFSGAQKFKGLARSVLFVGFFCLLTTVTISTVLSPFPLRSVTGHQELGFGLLHWVLYFLFFVSNIWFLSIFPQHVRDQFIGFICGTIILCLAIFAQSINWTLDFTSTMFQVSPNSLVLLSGIFLEQMPIGFFSHRGYAAIVVAMALVFIFALSSINRLSLRASVLLSILFGLALLLTNTRAAIVGAAFAILYIIARETSLQKKKKLLLIATLSFITSYSFFLGLKSLSIQNSKFDKASVNYITEKPEDPLKGLAQLVLNRDTGRLQMWKFALRGIAKRPVLGWGPTGLHMAYAFIEDCTNPVFAGACSDAAEPRQIENILENSFTYRTKTGPTDLGAISLLKAHNIFLDTALSIGLLGLAVYLVIFVQGFLALRKLNSGLEAIVLCYFVYCCFWYETVQFAHLFWWVLSLSALRNNPSVFMKNLNSQEN